MANICAVKIAQWHWSNRSFCAAEALTFLANISDVVRATFANEYAVQSIAGLLQHGNDLQKGSALVLLADLARGTDMIRASIVQTNCVTTLVALLRMGSSNQKRCAARVMAKLSFSEDIGAALGQEGGIELLVNLMRTGTIGDKMLAGIVLGNVALSDDAVRGMVIRQVFQLSRSFSNGNTRYLRNFLLTPQSLTLLPV